MLFSSVLSGCSFPSVPFRHLQVKTRLDVCRRREMLSSRFHVQANFNSLRSPPPTSILNTLATQLIMSRHPRLQYKRKRAKGVLKNSANLPLPVSLQVAAMRREQLEATGALPEQLGEQELTGARREPNRPKKTKANRSYYWFKRKKDYAKSWIPKNQ